MDFRRIEGRTVQECRPDSTGRRDYQAATARAWWWPAAIAPLFFGKDARELDNLYIASGRRNTTPGQEVENLQKLLERSKADSNSSYDPPKAIEVGRMLEGAKRVAEALTIPISGGFGFVYMLHYASCLRNPAKYQEYKLGAESYGSWFDPPLTVQDGKMTVPTVPGVGIKDLKGLLQGAVEVT